jgi:tetratricopeptide (TPR) repeat protein
MEKGKWYNNKALLIILLFIFPPVGIYGIFQRNSKLWKKLVYLFCALFMSLILFGIVIAILFPVNYYEEGNTLLNRGEYKEAINRFERVGKDNKQYKDALKGIQITEQKIDSIKTAIIEKEEEEERQKKARLDKLRAVKTNWADSIVKDWKGSFIKSWGASANSDTIYFQLTKNASKGNWRASTDLLQSNYQKNLDTLLNSALGTTPEIPQIIFIPDSLQHSINLKEAQREKDILKQFSVWDGSHTKLKRYVKNNMNDPKSFEHVESIYADKGSFIYVYMKFRGTNAFGAKVLNEVRAKVDLQGNILSVEQL